MVSLSTIQREWHWARQLQSLNPEHTSGMSSSCAWGAVPGALPLPPSPPASGSAAPSAPEPLGAPADSTIALCKLPLGAAVCLGQRQCAERAVAASHLSQMLSHTLNSSADIVVRRDAVCHALQTTQSPYIRCMGSGIKTHLPTGRPASGQADPAS